MILTFTLTYLKLELTFVIFDAKGGEIVHIDKIGLTKGTKGREIKIRREMTKERDQLKFEHTSRGSKLINLNGAFECVFHMYACIAQVLNSISMLVWCMLVVGLIDEMKN
jgi:hypothetical protein